VKAGNKENETANSFLELPLFWNYHLFYQPKIIATAFRNP
jgi:hypothetical protein